jgi:hypothetical protein
MTLTQSILNEVGSKNLSNPPYEWYDSAVDGKISAIFRSRVIKYGSFSTGERESSFRVTFSPQMLIRDGQMYWPLNNEFQCDENPSEIERLAKKLVLPPYRENAKFAIWRGKYRGYAGADGRTEFVIDEEHPKDVLFVSNTPLWSTGNLYNCDVVITHNFNAMPISYKKLREIFRN